MKKEYYSEGNEPLGIAIRSIPVILKEGL